MRQQILEDRLFDGFAFGGGLDDQVAPAQISQRQGCGDPAKGCCFVGLGDLFAGHLARQVAVDQGHGSGQACLGNIRHDNIIAGGRTDMRDAVAHLSRADDAD